MPQANEEFEKVRWLWAELVLNIKVFGGGLVEL